MNQSVNHCTNAYFASTFSKSQLGKTGLALTTKWTLNSLSCFNSFFYFVFRKGDNNIRLYVEKENTTNNILSITFIS